jgi:hypothetical protein
VFAKRSAAGCHKLEFYLKQLLFCNCWDVYLNFEEKHDVARYGSWEFKVVFWTSIQEIIYKVATRIPIILRPIKHFELNEGCLTRHHCRVILVFWKVGLRWNVCYVCQVFGGNSTF